MIFFLLKLNELKTMMWLEFVDRSYFWSCIFTKFEILRLYECTKSCLIMLRGPWGISSLAHILMLLYNTAVDWASFNREVVFDIMISQHEKTPRPTWGDFTQQVKGYYQFSCPSATHRAVAQQFKFLLKKRLKFHKKTINFLFCNHA